MSTRDPLRARLPKGFVVARSDSPPRPIWGGTIRLAVLCMLVLGTEFCGSTKDALRPSNGGGPLPLHPASESTAVIALWHERGLAIDGPIGPGELPRERDPMRVAFWTDGSVLWGTGDEDSGGRPYRTAHVSQSDVLALASRIRAVIEGLPPERRSNTAPDAGYDELAVVVDGACSRLRWMQGGNPDTNSSLGRVWRDARAILLAAVPAQGDPSTIEGVDYEFVR